MSYNFSFNSNKSTNSTNKSTNNLFNNNLFSNTTSTNTNNKSTNNLFNNNLFNINTSTTNTNKSTTNIFNNISSNNNNQSPFAMLSSKFQALPNDKKQTFISFEKNVIQDANKKQEKLQQAITKLEMLTNIEPQLNTDLEKVDSLTNKLSNYTQILQPFEMKTREEYECATELSLNIQRGNTHDFQMPPKFYWIKMKEFEKTVKDLQECMIGMEAHLKDIESQSNTFQSQNSISSALNASHATTIKMAAKVKALHDSVQKMKREYKAFRLQRFGDENNPFEDNDQMQNNVQCGMNSMLDLNVNYGLVQNGNGNQSIFSNGGQMNMNGGGNMGNNNLNASLVNGNSTSNTNSNSGGFTFGNSNSNNKPISWNFSSSSFSL